MMQSCVKFSQAEHRILWRGADTQEREETRNDKNT